MEKMTGPAVSDKAETVLEALLMFERYYETNKLFDHYTHGIGPGIVGVIMHKLIDYLGLAAKQKLSHENSGSLYFAALSTYISKMKVIVGTVVVDEVVEGTGRLKKQTRRNIRRSVPTP